MHMLSTPPPAGREFPAVSLHTLKIQITPRTSTFSHVSNRPAVFRLIVRRHNTLSMASHGCVTTRTIGACPLHGKIRRKMMVFHVRHDKLHFTNLPMKFWNV
jgi:hypothetical protein